jgi:hypothetical protein
MIESDGEKQRAEKPDAVAIDLEIGNVYAGG